MKRILSVLAVGLISFWAFPGPAMAVSMSQLKLNGFFDIEYEKADGPIGDEKGSFDQYHFNLLMEFPVSDTLFIKGHVEYEHGPQLPGNGDIKIEWSYAEYLLSNALKLRAGMALTPFGIYNEMHDATPTYLSIRTPWEIYRSDKVGGSAMFPKFSTGLFALGSYFTEGDLALKYVIYAANGENTVKNPAENDDNSNKALGGRVMVSPISGLTVGGSYFTGKKGTASIDHDAWILSAEYAASLLGLRAEYASSKLGGDTQVGWYGEASYTISTLTPYTRYGSFDPKDDQANDEWTEWVWGVYYPLQPNAALKAEYRQFGGNSGNIKVTEDYNEWATALTVAF